MGAFFITDTTRVKCGSWLARDSGVSEPYMWLTHRYRRQASSHI